MYQKNGDFRVEQSTNDNNITYVCDRIGDDKADGPRHCSLCGIDFENVLDFNTCGKLGQNHGYEPSMHVW